jgi:integrase
MKRGQGRIFKRGSVFWISYYAPKNGRSVEHREAAGETEKEARRLLRDRLAEVIIAKKGIRPFHGPHQERVPLSELLDDLEHHYEVTGKALPQLRSHLRHVRDFFSMDRALAVGPDRVLAFIAHRQQEGAAPATINREIEGLQRAFTYAVEMGKLSQAPRFPSLPEHNAREGFFERGDFEAVLANISDPDVSDFLSWFFWTGMRPKEIRSLTWEAFDRETMTIRLHAREAKIRKGRALALEGPLREIIDRRIVARRLDCPFIFHRAGRQMGEFRKTWRTACKCAGLAGLGSFSSAGA